MDRKEWSLKVGFPVLVEWLVATGIIIALPLSQPVTVILAIATAMTSALLAMVMTSGRGSLR